MILGLGWVLIVFAIFGTVSGFISFPPTHFKRVGFTKTSTTLFAHHVQKKITKRMMDRRPKKRRPSDINRNNRNHGKCITKMDLPDAYTIIPAAEFTSEHEAGMLRFWEEGSPEDPWYEITGEDIGPSKGQVPTPNVGAHKIPRLQRNGWGRGFHMPKK